LLKESQGRHQPARRLAAKGISKLESQSGLFLGIEVETFVKSVQDYLSGKRLTAPLIKLKGM
jgi:hypothetical protein